MKTDRLRALADGVFAIALTLLVLDLPRPPEDDPDLAGDVLHAWPSYAAYAVSFVTVAIFWVNQHRLMDGVTTTDRTAGTQPAASALRLARPLAHRPARRAPAHP